jgi:hypothetical protein
MTVYRVESVSPSLGPIIFTPRAAWPEQLWQRVRDLQRADAVGAVVRSILLWGRDHNMPADMAGAMLQALSATWVLHGSLRVWVHRHSGRIEDYGVTSNKVITTAGANFLVDAFQNLVELEVMKYHALGTNATAEAVGDTGCITELTTQYATANTRPTGTQGEGATNVYRTNGSNTLSAGATVQEHGLMSQAAAPGGTCLDRSLTGSQVLSGGETLQTQYDFTATTGG